ncbi:MAG TPA: hypothetical protein VMS11_01760 [Solirubrobacterales bacterium]|nr:hypothetical protein [Solirubrobacterales bacterium]
MAAESRTEYRVVHGETTAIPLTQPFAAKRDDAERVRDSYNPVGDFQVFHNIRLQESTVTRSPWTDLPEKEGGGVTTCVCKPGNPCLWHWGLIRDGVCKPSEVPHPENYKLAAIPRRLLRSRERLARRLAPWSFDPPRYTLADHLPASVPSGSEKGGER